eukprot:scaffold10156_cov98-Skeletonema_dohrnii-CCMP3373.AAC.7
MTGWKTELSTVKCGEECHRAVLIRSLQGKFATVELKHDARTLKWKTELCTVKCGEEEFTVQLVFVLM